jgi:hypothetical protein
MRRTKSGARRPAFQEGDRVRLKTLPEIEASLDPLMKHEGCLFTQEMRRWCGTEAAIIKIVKNYFDEHKLKMFRLKVPAYLLEGSICSGDAAIFDLRCDRSCFFIWHEDWMEEVPPRSEAKPE